jgi:hypothetical protein
LLIYSLIGNVSNNDEPLVRKIEQHTRGRTRAIVIVYILLLGVLTIVGIAVGSKDRRPGARPSDDFAGRNG